MAITLAEKVVKILRENPEERFTSRVLAEKIVNTDEYQDELADKERNSGIVSEGRQKLIYQLSAEIIARQNGIFRQSQNKVKVEGLRPRKYYYTEKSDGEEEEIEAEEQRAQKEPLERESYDGIVQFLYRQLDIYCKVIDDRKSSNNQGAGGNKWLHPDIVGLGDLSGNWQKKTKEYSHQFGNQRFQLWSFEVKKKVSRSDVREAFFQTVSNSSWAHYGYLVVNFGKDAEDVLNELRILSSLHGIGVIKYDSEEDDDSNGIVIQAREKNNVDWGTVNRLLNEKNKDFDTFMENVSDCHDTGKFPQGKWDTVIEDD